MECQGLVGEIGVLLDEARRTSARAVNAIMTATYWEIGRRIVEYEQQGKARAEYGEALLKRLAADLTPRCGRGFGVDNLQRFRLFYLAHPSEEIYATLSRKSLASPEGGTSRLAARFPLPWSAYVRLLAVKNENARVFYETEALRAGWSVRQLDRQIQSQFYERTALSRNKAAMLRKGEVPRPEDAVAAEEEVKDPTCSSFSASRTSTRRRISRRRSSTISRVSSWSSAATSALPAASGACASATSGTAWTSSSITAACAASC